MPGYGDALPSLLLVDPATTAELRLFGALHLAGVAATPEGRDGAGQKLFGARIVADPAPEWTDLRRFVRAIVAFGPRAWETTLGALSLEPSAFVHGGTVSSAGDRPVTVLGCLPLDGPDLTDAMLAETLSAAQRAAGLSWGCGGRG